LLASTRASSTTSSRRSFTSELDALDLLAEDVTAECALNDVDQAKLASSQKLVISALLFLWLAVLTGAGATVLGSLALNAAATVGSLSARSRSWSAFSTCTPRPCTQKVGAPCAKNAICYTSSVSIPLAIAAVVLSAASVIALSVATVLARQAGKTCQDNVMNGKGRRERGAADGGSVT
jgi:hypothetical protein